jgi:RNA polymerase sigma factor (sigma-70 family)
MVSESEQTDERLAAAAARRGDHDKGSRAAQVAFAELYRRYAPSLFAFIAARARPIDRDDLFQETWAKAWHRLPDQFHGGNFRAWLYQIARNGLIDHGRKKKPEPLTEPERVPGRTGNIDDGLLDAERMEALRRCLEKLSATAADVVRARLAGMDYAEVCRRLDLQPQQAHKLYHKAQELLKACVEPKSK